MPVIFYVNDPGINFDESHNMYCEIVSEVSARFARIESAMSILFLQ